MLGLKPFVQESVQILPPAQLRLLAETLRVDLRGCEDRGDIERVLTGLVCLDQDTSLGVFLTWLRSADLQQNDRGLLASKKPKFNNTFLPVIASSPAQHRPNNQRSKIGEDDGVKDHHLDDEIKQQLDELELLEASFKKAERLVHTGSPSFEKLKQFLVELTVLRAKEQKARVYLVRQASVLQKQHEEMRAEMLHSRAQLDFFVEGFTNLRKRHDVLLADATRMKAESESTQDILVSMSAHDCHFEQLMRNTLHKQMEDNDELQRRLKQTHGDLETAAKKHKELEAQISQLKQERGDALKDAYCYKRQLRVCKTRMQKLQQAGGGTDGSFFRGQSVALRQTIATLIGLLRDSVVKDTKSPKQTLSKEVLSVMHKILTPSMGTLEPEVLRSSRLSDSQLVATDESQPQVVQRSGNNAADLDEVIRGVLLVEGAIPGDAADCARIMCEKLRYLSVDVKATLMQLQQEEEQQAQVIREEEHNKQLHLFEQMQQTGGQGTGGGSDNAAAMPPSAVVPIESRPLTLESYAAALKKRVDTLMSYEGKRGVVMFNWPFSRRDVNLLTSAGLSVDSVLNLEITGNAEPIPATSTSTSIAPVIAAARMATAVASTPSSSTRSRTPAVVKAPVSDSSTRGKAAPATQLSRGKASPSKAASTSPVKPVSRTAASSGSKDRTASSTRSTPGAKKPIAATSPSKPKTPAASAPAKPGSSSSQRSSPPTETAKTAKIVPTAASKLQGLGGLLQSVGPATFPAERVNLILQVLEQQRRRKVAPVVQWDETTHRTNELLAMWAEEVHMLLHLEQESRKPHKAPMPSATASGPTKPTSRAASPSKTSTTKAGAKKTAASPTRSKSPTKGKMPSTSVSRVAKK